MITKVYLAGASAELARAREWASKLRDADIMVTSTWVEVIGRVGAANPANATIEQLTKWVLRDLAEVSDSDVLWLLLPPLSIQTVGAWIELGTAQNEKKHIVMSGPHRPIFTPVLANAHFEADQAAFDYIQEHHRVMVRGEVEAHTILKERLRLPR